MKPIVLITGATAGIGEATAELFACEQYPVIITGRRHEKLEALKTTLTSKYNARVFPLHFDVRDKSQVDNAIDSLPDDWKEIGILINNAGLAAGLNPVHEGAVDDWERMIDTNVKGLLYMTRKISPGMVKNQSGHIINVSSIAGKEVYPNGNVYCGTKHAVSALTKGTRIDLLPHGIKVSSVCPGMVETEFSLVRFKGDAENAQKVYEGFTPLCAEDVADTIFYIASRPVHVNIDDVLIMPSAQASARDLSKK